MRATAWRRASALVAVLVLGLAIAGPVGAATPPVNDEPAGAIDLGSSSQIITGDLTNATRSATDPACGGNTPTIWYTFTPADDGTLFIGPISVDFLVYVGILDGPPDRSGLDGCVTSPGFGFPVFKGTQYYLMVIGSGNGVMVNLTFIPSRIALAADQDAQLNADGSVVVTGTETCGEPEGILSIVALAGQPQPSSRRTGTGGAGIECPFEHPWSITIQPDGQAFHPGRMSLTLSAVRCGLTHCDARRVETNVWVRH